MSQTPQQVKTPPFCCHCAHFIPEVQERVFIGGDPKVEYQTGEKASPPRCRKFPMLDVVIGEKFFVACHAVRGQDAPCGIEGKLFEPNDDLDKPKNVPPISSVEPEKHDLN
jgi:hypothetical protein